MRNEAQLLTACIAHLEKLNSSNGENEESSNLILEIKQTLGLVEFNSVCTSEFAMSTKYSCPQLGQDMKKCYAHFPCQYRKPVS